MIRNLLATTAIATLLASGAVAQTPPAGDPAMNNQPAAGQQQQRNVIHAEGHLASNLIGEDVYNGTGDDAETIGEVVDLVISPDGNVEAIVVGVGGFLGIGQKNVALEFNLVEWSEQQDGDRWLIVQTTKDALEAQEEFDRAAYEPMPADADVAQTRPATAEDLAVAPTGEQNAERNQQSGDTAAAPEGQAGERQTDTAQAPAEGNADQNRPQDLAVAPNAGQPADQSANQPANQDMAAQNRPAGDAGANQADQTQTGAIDRNNLQQAQPDQISAENLVGTAVYGANEERLGEIGDVILTQDGQVDAIIVDVGGFLGIGEKQVAIGMDNLTFMADEDGDLYLYTEFTKEQLEAQPAYDESAYAQSRDEMRMQVQ